MNVEEAKAEYLVEVANRENWVELPIHEAAEVNPRIVKSSIPDELPVSFVPMHAVGAGDGTIMVNETRPAGEVKKGFTAFLEGDVLFAKITPCMENGKMAVVPELCNGFGFGSTEFHVLRPKPGIDAKYLYYFVSSQSFRSEAERNMTGAVGQRRVPTAYLKECRIPVAPLHLQKGIVAEIEKQFSRLDEAVSNLNRVKANLKSYKAAVLKAAVEGKLTEEWRKAHPGVEPASKLLDRILAERRAKWEEAELAKMKTKGKPPKTDDWKQKYNGPPGPEASNLPWIPDTWTWVTLPQLGELNRGKSKHRPRNDPKLYGGDYPFVQTGDVRQANGKLQDWTQTYSEEGLRQSRLWPEGTLCITIAANIADTALLGFDACFPDSVVGFIAKHQEVETGFLEFFLRTAKENLERFAPATAQKNINLKVLERVAIALPPYQEQKKIIEEIEKRFSVSESLDLAFETNQKRAVRLGQSILKKGYSGQLLRGD
ncbi:MAG: restriction endonuclease subunit S [Kordiimonadaceae bacterium]|nr:restriction endonuclease subunit S [Kordiimonadaceae bacterium]